MAEEITDYYEKLNLDNSLSVSELNTELSRLETVWKRREITNPEKAAKMLLYIIEARKVFQTDSTRASYDKALAESKKKPVPVDGDAERREQLDKWLDDALR